MTSNQLAKTVPASLPVITIEQGGESDHRGQLAKIEQRIVETLGTRLESVLVVEDNPDARALVAQVFEATGTALTYATTGEEALALLAAKPIPSAVILDLMLPGLTGFDVLEEMKRDARLQKVPTIVLSAMDLSASQLSKLEAMAAAILQKGEGAPERALTAALAANRPLVD